MKLKKINIFLCITIFCFLFHFSYGQGDRYTGSYIETAAIKHVGKSDFVIEGLEFTNIDGDIIGLYNCKNVTIRNNKFSSSTKRGIFLYNCENIVITDNTFENVHTALTAILSKGVKFEHNDVYNVGGLLALSDDTNNGFVVLFDKVSGEGNSISYNVAENIFGESSPGDLINVNQSHGTARSPIMVKGNWLRGGGPSPSGGGILLGDIGGSYQIAEENILVDPGQYGIGIAGGSNMALRNNKVYAKSQYFTNVGINVCNYYEKDFGKSSNITVKNNRINYLHSTGRISNWWFYDNMEPIDGKDTNVYDPILLASILPDVIIGRARLATGPDPSGPSTTDPSGHDTENDSSISIYLDKYDRVCVNCKDAMNSSATVTATDVEGKTIYGPVKLTRFHTILPDRPVPGKYIIIVKKSDMVHRKTLNIP